jgi:hypothetical protein
MAAVLGIRVMVEEKDVLVVVASNSKVLYPHPIFILAQPGAAAVIINL